MPYLIYGPLFGLGELATGVESICGCLLVWGTTGQENNRGKPTLFEEKAYLVSAREEVFIPYMIAILSSRELGHGVVIEGEIIEHGMCLLE